MIELPESLKKAEKTAAQITDKFVWERNRFDMWLPSSVVASFLEENDVMEAVAFFQHLKNHPEVKAAPVHAGMPVCKICGKSSKEIAVFGEGKRKWVGKE